MQYRGLIVAMAILASVGSGCSKTDDQPIDPSGETATAIITISGEPTPTGAVYTVSVYEPTGALRWKKVQWGYVNNLKVDNNRLFITGAPPDYTFGGKMGVYNLQTGAEIWSKIIAKEDYYQTIVRNDTLFCSENVTLTGNALESYITAYNAGTGAVYWKKKMGNSWYPFNMILRDSSMYCVVPTNPYPSGTVTSMNIRTREINWSRPISSIGSNLSIFSLAMHDDRLMLTGQNSNQHSWIGMDRFSGVNNWNITTQRLQGVIKFDNTLYGVSMYNLNNADNGLYAYDVNSGTKKWSASVPNFGSTPQGFTVSNAGFFFSYWDNISQTLRKYDAATGGVAWTTRVPLVQFMRGPVTVGNRVFAQHFTYGGAPLQTLDAKVFCYDVTNGVVRDSFAIPKDGSYYLNIVGSSGTIYTSTGYQ